MAESGLVAGLLGGAEAEEREAEQSVGSADAAAITVAMDAARYDPELSQKAGNYLDRQSNLVDEQRALVRLQVKHFDQERHLAIQAAKRKRFSDRLKVGTQLFFILIASVLGLGALVMLRDAVTSRSVVVEPFDAPPALAARGLSGKAVAGSFLDELTRLQAATRSAAAKRNLSNAWTSEIRIEVPETGVSIGEIDRLLKARFGHDLHIGGELVQTEAGGLALTVRGDGVLPKTFLGAPGEFDKLTAQAAEYVYGQSQPSLYATYLRNQGRDAEAITFAKTAFAGADASERPYLLNQWANAMSTTGTPAAERLPLYREALKLKPDYWVAYNNVMNSALMLADEEGAWRTGETMRKVAGGRPGRAGDNYFQNWDLVTWNLQAWRAGQVADAAKHAGVGTGTTANGPVVADIDVRLHDPTDAAFQLQIAQGDATDPTVGAMTHFVHGRLAAEAGDAPRAASELEAFGAAYAIPDVSSNFAGYNCWIAPAEEAAGHPDKADAVLNAGGHFVDCFRFRADILDHRGDWAGAQRAYAAAVALAPDLPAGYYSWGVALARHGDLVGAQAKLAAANTRGPHWADPLKASGDVLARQGRRKEALAKYDAALKYAPAWAALHQARDAASKIN